MHYQPRKCLRTVADVLLAFGAAVAAPAVAAAHPSRGGFVYVNDNTAGTNTVAAFVRHPNGGLTPVPGSPFIAGGAGSGTGLASQASRSRATAGTRWPSTPAATRSRF